MIIRSLLVTLTLCLAITSAAAHAPGRGHKGGQMQDLAGEHIELLAQGNEIVVYLFDADDKPSPAEQAKATATVLPPAGRRS